jgi:hypothetical protein
MGPSKPLATHPIITAADLSDSSESSWSDSDDDADISSMSSSSSPQSRGPAARAAALLRLSPDQRVGLPAKFTKHGKRYHIHVNVEVWGVDMQ